MLLLILSYDKFCFSFYLFMPFHVVDVIFVWFVNSSLKRSKKKKKKKKKKTQIVRSRSLCLPSGWSLVFF